MPKELSAINGFSLVELLLGVSLFGLVVTALGGGLVYGLQTPREAGARGRAVFLAEEGLEAARNIRDDSFANLADGTYGLAVTSGQWELSGSSDSKGIFSREVAIEEIDSDRRQVTSTVTWDQNPQRSGEVSAVTYLTNWSDDTGGGPGGGGDSCASFCQDLDYSAGTCRQNSRQCINNDETHESGGDSLCTGGASADTCCCSL